MHHCVLSDYYGVRVTAPRDFHKGGMMAKKYGVALLILGICALGAFKPTATRVVVTVESLQ
jgi:hypothetical protein